MSSMPDPPVAFPSARSETMARFRDTVAIVVGGASGIGASTVARLVAEGATVAILDRNAELGAAVAEELGERALFESCDVSEPSAVEASTTRAIDRLGGLDYLVNCAGTFTLNSVLNETAEDWDLVLEVNLRGQVLTIKACAEALKIGGGAIVNVASIEADIVQASGESATASYAASKAAVKMMSKAAAYDLAKFGVRVNTVDPGFIRTPFTGEVDLTGSPMDEPRTRRIVLGRWGEAYDIAAAITFLLSDDAGYITGANIVVDGGWRIQ